jgi:hypothetical protein
MQKRTCPQFLYSEHNIPSMHIRLTFTFWVAFLKKFLFYSYAHTVFGAFLPPSPRPLSCPSLPLANSRNYSALISNFVEESVSNNRKDQGFLLVEIKIAY